jgi:hypothetical protein
LIEKLHGYIIEMNADKAVRTSIRIYSLSKSKRLGTNIKLALQKALIRSVMTYACPVWKFAADTQLPKLQRLNKKVISLLALFQGAHRQANCTWLSKFLTYTILLHNYASSKQKSDEIMTTKMFATLDRTKPNTRNIRGLNRAAVKRTTVQVSRLPLYYSIGQLGHDVQHKAWADGSHKHLVFASV